MATAKQWISGARPRTLVAGVSPVIVGTFAAETWTLPRLVLCLLVALGLQIGENYLNDAADAGRGIDAFRKGPARLVASGAASRKAVLTASGLFVLLGVAAGLGIAFIVGAEAILVGFLLLFALFGYSGGPRPYASMGLGEVFVFVSFGLVATVGTVYVHTGEISATAIWAAIPIGFAAVALMLANNVRDIETDGAAGKRTLTVRLGRAGSIVLFRVVLVAIFVSIALGMFFEHLPRASWLALLAAPLAAGPWGRIASPQPLELVPVLQQTAILQAQLTLALSVAYFFG